MPDVDDPWIDKNFESRVRDTAYFLWENDGRPLGREKDYWFSALERCLRQREADSLLQKEPLQAETHADNNVNDPVGGGQSKRLDQPLSGTSKR